MKKLLSVFIVCLMLMFSAAAEATVMSVEGTGVVIVPADAARIILGVQASSADVIDAQATANAKIDAICAALMNEGVSELQISTQSLYIYGDYNYEVTPSELVGYTVSNSLTVYATDIESVGRYIDVAFSAGATTLDYIEFIANDTDEARDEALRLAVESAREKAEILAECLGMVIDSVVSVTEGGVAGYNEVGTKTENIREAADGTGAATQIRSPSLQISARVTIEYELTEGES